MTTSFSLALSAPVLLALPRVVSQVVSQFPRWEAGHILMEAQEDLAMIRGDYFQVSFCIKSILAYLLRYVPEDGIVNVSLTSDSSSVLIRITGQTPALPSEIDESNGAHADISHTMFELALGIDTMSNLVHQNGGSLFGPQRSGELDEFEMTFPVLMGES